MAVRQITFADLRLNEKVTLKLRDGESVIVGTVTTLPTPGQNAKVTLTNNKNSVIVTPNTNFRIFADRGPTVGDTLTALQIGKVFTYKNKYGVTKKWVKTGADRVTLVADDRPAHSLSISGGFPVTEDAGSRIRVTY
jgi:hypothetical protein